MEGSRYQDFMVLTLYFDTHDFVYSEPLKFKTIPIKNGGQFWSIPRTREKTLLVIAVDETNYCHEALRAVQTLVTDIIRELGTKYANFGEVMLVRLGSRNFQFAPKQCADTIEFFKNSGLYQFFVNREKRPYFTTEESGCRLTNGELIPYENLFVSRQS